MALTDQHWEKALIALRLKAREVPGSTRDTMGMLKLMKENWELLSDERQLDTFIADQELVELKATRDIQQVELDLVNEEINRRE